VDVFVGIGSGRELDALAKGVDEKYGITGLGGYSGCCWSGITKLVPSRYRKRRLSRDPHPVRPRRRAPSRDSPHTRHSPVLEGLHHDG
jgi:hypothetical protein